MSDYLSPAFVPPPCLVHPPPGFETMPGVEDQLRFPNPYPIVTDYARYQGNSGLPPNTAEYGTSGVPIYKPQIAEPWQLVPPEAVASTGECDFHKSRLAGMISPQPSPPAAEPVLGPAYDELISSSYEYLMNTYSRKVFVGGLPKDICGDEIASVFSPFGPLAVTWPKKYLERSEYPPKGYAFLIFCEEVSVHHLIDSCVQSEDKLFFFLSSSTVHLKATDIRPWKIIDSDFIMYPDAPVDVRTTVFVGGLPRTVKARELAHAMDMMFGGVCYASIAIDHLLYPKGVGRVGFSNLSSYIAAVNEKFAYLPVGDAARRRIEIRPYIMDNQQCDQCREPGWNPNGSRLASYYCTDINCLKYFCEACWETCHFHHDPMFGETRPWEPFVGRPIGYKSRYPYYQSTDHFLKHF